MKISIKREQNDACIGSAKREKFGTMFKKTFRFLSTAALALMGAMMTGCSSDDNFDNPQQPENKSNVVTLTTTVGFDASAGTRALTIDGTKGVKTFAVNDQIAVVYKKKTGGATAVAVSEKLTSTDIASGSKSATFTVTLDDPDKTKDVTYIYPAAMAGETGVDLTKLNSQEGTFDALQSKYDLCTKSGAWDAGNLPSLTLENQLAILAITLNNNGDINNTIKDMTISDGTYCYSIDRTPSDGAIYVAIRPTSGATISVSATSSVGTQTYFKYLTDKTYEKNNGYVLNWSMVIYSFKMASAATSEDKGKQICTAGHIHPAGGDAGCTQTRVAKIVYVGNETGEASFGFIHGLALALSDANDGQAFKWRREVHPGHTLHKYYTDKSNFAIESGLQYNANHNSGDYPAFQAAIANNGTAAPTGCSSWFLASGYQWKKMIDASGLNNLGLEERWNTPYWSSTECDPRNAWYFFSVYGGWFSDHENNDTQVRSCLAF